MKRSAVHWSLVGLALAAVAGPAGAAPKAPLLLAQAETDAASSPQADAAAKLLQGTQDVSGLSDDKLQQRLNRARKLREAQGLPPDLDAQLQQLIASLEAEASRRQEASAAPAPQPPVQEQVNPEPKLEEPPLPPATAEAPPSAEAAPAGQKPRRKRQAEQQAEQPAEQPAPPPPVQEAAPQPAPAPAPVPAQPPVQQAQPAPQPAPAPATPPVQQAQPAPAPAPGQANEVAVFLQTVRPAAELDRDALRRQMQRATDLADSPNLTQDQRRALRNVIRDARTALRGQGGGQAQQPQPTQPQPQPQPGAGQQPQPQPGQAAQVNPALEQQARALLNDKTDVRTMKRRELRQRLSRIRDLLASNQLSPPTSEALRQKLAAERSVLRNDVAVDEGVPPPNQPPPPRNNQGQQPRPGKGNGNGNGGGIGLGDVDINVILRDRRPPRELDDRQLVRRIDIYRNAVADERYGMEERQIWRRQMEEDRRYLRRQMIEERRQREARLRSGQMNFDYSVQDDYEPGYDVPDDVFAAEVEDDEIAGVLVAPPRRQINRRYTLDEIERTPEARNAVARIEIDTVHFGFGEGFLREEEIDKLDRIAQVLEKILARHPDEVFLIEGHTDAVGSDAANLQLSRQRAQAVKEALVTYYVIPAANLKTVGLGERYLKIPTTQPEPENRRVSLARITPLIGQAQ